MSTPTPSLEAVMQQHGPFLRRLARSLVRDEQRAGDLVQDVWTAAAADGGPARASRGWLATVLRRRATSDLRKRVPKPASGELERVLDRAPAQDEVAEQIERQALLQAALERLDDPYRTAIYLRFYEDMKPRAIAVRMDAPVRTVDSWLRRGLEKLRLDLDRSFGGGEEGRAAWLASMSLLAVGVDARLVPTGGGTRGVDVGAPASLSMPIAIAVAASLACAVSLGAWALQEEGDAAHRSSIAQIAPTAAETEVQDQGDAADVAAVANGAPRTSIVTTDPPAQGSTTSDLEIAVTLLDEHGSVAANRMLVLSQRGWDGVPGGVQVRATNESGIAHFHIEPGLRCTVRDLLGTAGGDLDELIRSPEAVAGATIQATIRAGATLRATGQVVDAEGTPQAGAAIYAMAWDNAPPEWFAVGTADDAGMYEIEGGEWLCYQAIVPGRLPSEAVFLQWAPPSTTSSSAGDREVDLVIGEPGATLSGRVVDSTGSPVERAAVMAGPLGRLSGSKNYFRRPSPVIAFTDANGRFEYPAAIPAGEQPIAISAKGFATKSFTRTFGAEPKWVNAILDEGSTITGRVIDHDGSPAAGVSVWISDAEDRWRTQAYGPKHGVLADEEGRFVLRRVGHTSRELRSESRYPNDLTRGSLPWTSASPSPVEIRLEEGDVIAGRVVDEFGAPIVDAVVEAQTEWHERHPRPAHTNADGRFRLCSMPTPNVRMPGREPEWIVIVRASSGPIGQVLARREGVAPGTTDLVLQADRAIEATAVIEGRIVSSDGPIPGNATLYLSKQTGKSLVEEDHRGIPFDHDSGTFRYGPVAPGTYGLILRQIEVGELVSRNGIEVDVSGVVDVGELRIGSGGSLELTFEIELPDLLPPAMLPTLLDDQWLEIVSPYRRFALERSGSGWRSESMIPAGEYELRRRSGEVICVPPTTVVIEDGETNSLTVECSIGRPVQVHVSIDPDLDWASASLRVTNAAGQVVQLGADKSRSAQDDGGMLRFLESMPPGQATIELWVDGSATGTAVQVQILGFTDAMNPVLLDHRR